MAGTQADDDAEPMPDVAAVPRQSCLSLAPTCGAGSNEDCCAGDRVAGGSFYRAMDLAGSGNATAPATVGSFTLDRFEITVGRFRAFVAAGGGIAASAPSAGSGAHPRLAESGWRKEWDGELAASTEALEQALRCGDGKWTDTPEGRENYAIGCLSWYEAFAFCAWDGGSLPTDAEWNFAAAGGDEQRVFPWSSPPESTSIDAARADYVDGRGGPVGSHPTGAGRWGHQDLSGGVWEMVLDWQAKIEGACADCAALAPDPTFGSPSARIHRGGGYTSPSYDLRTVFRGATPPSERGAMFGARCARL